MNKEHFEQFKKHIDELNEAKEKIASATAGLEKLKKEFESHPDYQSRKKYRNSYWLTSDILSRASIFGTGFTLIDEKLRPIKSKLQKLHLSKVQ